MNKHSTVLNVADFNFDVVNEIIESSIKILKESKDAAIIKHGPNYIIVDNGEKIIKYTIEYIDDNALEITCDSQYLDDLDDYVKILVEEMNKVKPPMLEKFIGGITLAIITIIIIFILYCI